MASDETIHWVGGSKTLAVPTGVEEEFPCSFHVVFSQFSISWSPALNDSLLSLGDIAQDTTNTAQLAIMQNLTYLQEVAYNISWALTLLKIEPLP